MEHFNKIHYPLDAYFGHFKTKLCVILANTTRKYKLYLLVGTHSIFPGLDNLFIVPEIQSHILGNGHHYLLYGKMGIYILVTNLTRKDTNIIGRMRVMCLC
jgi:hypothetical protein